MRGALEPGYNDTAGADERPTPIRATTVAGAPAEMALLAGGTVLIAYGSLALVAAVAGLVLARRRSPMSGTG